MSNFLLNHQLFSYETDFGSSQSTAFSICFQSLEFKINKSQVKALMVNKIFIVLSTYKVKNKIAFNAFQNEQAAGIWLS